MTEAGVPTPSHETRSIRLPSELVAALEQRVRGTSFDSVDAFIAFILARLLDQPGTGGFTEEEERSLRERLRSLGYID
jgi:Arc/MetJ-type ribon-helix-helix transcriptional regulator